jgi:type IV secretory pathway TrbD component
MTKNVGGADRTLRIVGGLVVIAAGVYFKAWWGVIGAVLLATALIGWCPLYLPFGLSTLARRK